MDPKTISGVSALILFFLLEHFLPHYSWRRQHIRHSAYNLTMIALGGLLGRFVFLGLNLALFGWIQQNRIGLIYLLHLSAPVRIFLSLVLFDMWMYFWHRANHRIGLLWLFHKAHHNDPEMDASTSLRLHPIELCFSSIIRLPVFVLIGMDVPTLALYEAILMASILFHHSNIAIRPKLDHLLRIFIVTPDMHRMHHSIIGSEVNSNYSSIVPFWDKIFRSFTPWTDTKKLVLGLKTFREEKWQTPLGILAVPFASMNQSQKETL